jgi:hypothetical protein
VARNGIRQLIRHDEEETSMMQPPDHPTPVDGELVSAADMTAALTVGTLQFGDGSTQDFTTDGKTTYTEQGRTTAGEWSVVSDGKFSSFWPPDYRATYTLRWIVDGDAAVGVSFTEDAGGQRFDGRYH